jgi:hypothetical protein
VWCYLLKCPERKIEGGLWQEAATVPPNTISYEDPFSGLQPFGRYYYRVKSFSGTRSSPYSNEVLMVAQPHLLSLSPAATGPSSQRKVVNAGGFTHAVYESGGSIFYTRYDGTDWSPEIPIWISSTASNASIGFSTTAGTYLQIAWTDRVQNDPVNWTTYYKWSANLGVSWQPDPIMLAGLCNEPTNPVVSSGPYSAVIWKGWDGLRVMHDPWRNPVTSYRTISYTDATTRDVSVTQRFDASGFYYDLAFVKGAPGARKTYHQQLRYFPYSGNWYWYFGNPLNLSGSYSWMSDCANTSIINDGLHFFIVWDALCDNTAEEAEEDAPPQFTRKVILREYADGTWKPVVKLDHYGHGAAHPTVGLNLDPSVNKMSIAWSCGSHIVKISRGISGGWGQMQYVAEGAYPSLTPRVESGERGFLAYTSGIIPPYQIVLQSDAMLQVTNGSEPENGLKLPQLSGGNNRFDPICNVRLARCGAVKLDSISIPGLEWGALSGSFWMESPSFEIVRGATREEVSFSSSDSSTLSQWLGTISFVVPNDADVLNGRAVFALRDFAVNNPRVPRNLPVVLTEARIGNNRQTALSLTVGQLMGLAARDAVIAFNISVPARPLRGKTIRLTQRLLGQDEGRQPAWSASIYAVGADSLQPGNTLPLAAPGNPDQGLPTVFALHQGYPNPFNPTATIKFDMPEDGNVSLVVYDVLGREVTRLVDGFEEAGYRAATWNATGVASGVYFARLNVGDANGGQRFTAVRKLVVMK